MCTSFEIIDDSIALEEDEVFVVNFSPEEGEFTIGDNSQTKVTIHDNDGKYSFSIMIREVSMECEI